jgi:hypothetical protein
MRVALAVILAAILGAAFIYHERRSALEHELGAVGSQLAERPVRVHCQGIGGDLVDVTPEAGTVQFDRGADQQSAQATTTYALQRIYPLLPDE